MSVYPAPSVPASSSDVLHAFAGLIEEVDSVANRTADHAAV